MMFVQIDIFFWMLLTQNKMVCVFVKCFIMKNTVCIWDIRKEKKRKSVQNRNQFQFCRNTKLGWLTGYLQWVIDLGILWKFSLFFWNAQNEIKWKHKTTFEYNNNKRLIYRVTLFCFVQYNMGAILKDLVPKNKMLKDLFKN